MISEGASTEDLLRAMGKALRVLGSCVKHGRGRETAWDELQTLMQAAEGLGMRLGLVDWHERPPAVEEDAEEEGQRAWRGEVSLVDLTGGLYEAEDLDDDADTRLRLQNLTLRRQDIMRGIISYTCKGCKSAEEVTRRWLAMVRRVAPELLDGIGLSQEDVARVLDERRATTSAREKRDYERPLKAAGARGYVGAGGARGATNRERCSKAQKGNRNRAAGHARKQAG